MSKKIHRSHIRRSALSMIDAYDPKSWGKTGKHRFILFMLGSSCFQDFQVNGTFLLRLETRGLLGGAWKVGQSREGSFEYNYNRFELQ